MEGGISHWCLVISHFRPWSLFEFRCSSVSTFLKGLVVLSSDIARDQSSGVLCGLPAQAGETDFVDRVCAGSPGPRVVGAVKLGSGFLAKGVADGLAVVAHDGVSGDGDVDLPDPRSCDRVVRHDAAGHDQTGSAASVGREYCLGSSIDPGPLRVSARWQHAGRWHAGRQSSRCDDACAACFAVNGCGDSSAHPLGSVRAEPWSELLPAHWALGRCSGGLHELGAAHGPCASG